MLKKLLSMILVLSMILTLSISLVSCGGDDNTDNGNGENNGDNSETPVKVTYTVTVVDQNGDPVKDVMINFYPKGGTSFFYLTNKEGATDAYRTDKEVTVSVGNIPEGYTYDNLGNKQSFDKDGNLVITVNKVQGVLYTIRLVDQNGNPVVGAGVQMCIPGGSCVPFDNLTDADGVATKTMIENSFKAQITSLPEGYTDTTNGDYQSFETNPDGGYIVEIEVVKN